MTLVHTNVPDDQISYEQGGWEQYYFEPMKAYFSEAKGNGRGVAKKTKPAAPRTKRKRATTKGTKAKRKPGTAARATLGKKKPKKARVAVKAKAKRATGAKGRSSRGTRRR